MQHLSALIDLSSAARSMGENEWVNRDEFQDGCCRLSQIVAGIAREVSRLLESVALERISIGILSGGSVVEVFSVEEKFYLDT